MTPDDRPILWVRVGLPGCRRIWPVWMIHRRPPFDGPGWWPLWAVTCAGVTVYVIAPTAARAKGRVIPMALDGMQPRRLERGAVFRGLRAVRASCTPEGMRTYQAKTRITPC